jgi:hypothetical protein
LELRPISTPPSSEPKCTFSKIGKNLVAKKHPKRPRDFSQAAKLVIDVATGQVEDREPTPEEQGKDPGATTV